MKIGYLMAAIILAILAALLALWRLPAYRDGPEVALATPVALGRIAAPESLLALDPDGAARVLAAGLDRPTSIALAADGSVYVAQRGSVVKVDSTGGGTRKVADFGRPFDIAMGPEGVLYIVGYATDADETSAGLYSLDTKGKLSRVYNEPRIYTEVAVSPTGERWLANYNGDTVIKAGRDFVDSRQINRLGGPTDMAFGPDGGILVALLARARIVRIDYAQKKIEPVLTRIPAPGCVALDFAGNIYVGSLARSTVYRFDAEGRPTAIAHGVASPQGLAVGEDGTVYVLNGSERHDMPPPAELRKDGSPRSRPSEPARRASERIAI